MSLIIDSLKKIKSSSVKSGGSVPPSLLNLSPKGGGKKPSTALLVLLAVALLGLLFIIFMPMNDSSDYQVSAPARNNTVNQQTTPMQTAQAPAPQQNKYPDPLPVQTEGEPSLAGQNVADAPAQDAQFDPTAANKKRLEAMKSLPEIIGQVYQQPKKIEAPKDALGVLANAGIIPANPSDKPVEQIQVNNGQQIVQQQQPVQHQNPVFVAETYASKKAKAEYERRIDYNTKSSQAAAALAKGDNRKAETLYTELMKTKATKEGLNNLLTAKIRMGKVNELDRTIQEYKSTADSAVISNAALEMNKYGMSIQALAFLANYTDISGSGQIYYAAGIIQDQAGNLARAESAYEKALDMSPADPYFLYAAARNKDIQKKYEQAVTLYAKLQQVSAESSIKSNAKSRMDAINDYLEKMKESETPKEKQ